MQRARDARSPPGGRAGRLSAARAAGRSPPQGARGAGRRRRRTSTSRIASRMLERENDKLQTKLEIGRDARQADARSGPIPATAGAGRRSDDHARSTRSRSRSSTRSTRSAATPPPEHARAVAQYLDQAIRTVHVERRRGRDEPRRRPGGASDHCRSCSRREATIRAANESIERTERVRSAAAPSGEARRPVSMRFLNGSASRVALVAFCRLHRVG